MKSQKRRKQWKRIIAGLCTLSMMCTMLPYHVYAAEDIRTGAIVTDDFEAETETEILAGLPSEKGLQAGTERMLETETETPVEADAKKIPAEEDLTKITSLEVSDTEYETEQPETEQTERELPTETETEHPDKTDSVTETEFPEESDTETDTEIETEIEPEEDTGNDVEPDTECPDEADDYIEDPTEVDLSLFDMAISERAECAEEVMTQEAAVDATGITPTQRLVPSTATARDVMLAARKVILSNEVSSDQAYGAINRNDNGHGISLGLLQWNSDRALYLLQRILDKDPQAEKTLGTKLYKKIKEDDSWSGYNSSTRFVPTTAQATAIAKVLSSDVGKKVQDAQVESDIYTYISVGYDRWGIRNAAALVYFCDLTNQCGSGNYGGTTGAGRVANAAKVLAGGSASDVTLNELHEAALLDTVAGVYAARRFATYTKAADTAVEKHWDYYNAGDRRIPVSTVGSASKSEEIAWLQNALNLSNAAGLDVDGKYGSKSRNAVRAFQQAYQGQYHLAVDGYAGKATIVALLRVLKSKNKLGMSAYDFAKIQPVLKSAGYSSGLAKLSWEKVVGASGYYIYRKVDSGSYKKIGTVKSGLTLTYTDKSPQAGSTNYYRIAAYQAGGITLKSNEKSVFYLQTPVPGRASASKNCIKFSWSPVNGAEGYIIYRKSGSSAYSEVKRVSGQSANSYTDNGLTAKTTYVYTVRAYKGGVTSGYDAKGCTATTQAATTTITPKKPSLKSAVITTSGVKLTWKKAGNAKGYYVYRKTGNGKYSKIATLKSAGKVTYTDKKAKNGKTYTYAVKSYNGKKTSANSNTKKIRYQAVAKYKTTARLNYRTGAGTTHGIVGTFAYGQTVYVVKSYKKNANGYTWYKILRNNKYYYVASRYLKKA